MAAPGMPPNRFGAFERPIVFALTILALVLVGVVLWFGVLRRIEPVPPEPPPPPDRLMQIIKRGTLKVATRDQACCIEQYDGHRSGFELELAQRFATQLGVRLEIRRYKNWAGMQTDLNKNNIDLIAARTPITPTRRQQVDFSKSYAQDSLSLVVHRDGPEISGEADLAHQIVHVHGNSAAHEYAAALQKKYPGLKIVAHRNAEPAKLVRRVAAREIPTALVTSFTAKRFRRYYPRVEVAFTVNPKLDIGWAVAKGQKRLLARINQFLAENKKRGVVKQLQKHYFGYLDAHEPYAVRSFYKALAQKLPPYIKRITATADRHNFDWKLIIAQIYQESHFDPYAISTKGAQGLMQLTEAMATEMGVTDTFDPHQSIDAGVAQLKNLYDFYDNATGWDRVYIALAAYNVGVGHMLDARNLARKMDLNPDRWTSMVKTLPLLSQYRYFRDTIYGYCDGKQPLKYVRRIRSYYDILNYHHPGP